MKSRIPEGDFGFFETCDYGEVLEIQFKNNLLEHLVDFSKRDTFIEFAKRISASERIKVVLLNSDFSQTDCGAYTRFIHEKISVMDKFDIHRLCNLTRQLITGIIDLDRIVIHACSGSVISIFLNISLACDYRIISDETVFCNPYMDIGMIPVGGGPYLLSKISGTGNAWETLLLNRKIDAFKALELGLVDRVVKARKLPREALELSRKFAQRQFKTISGLKKLINFSKKDLDAYFEIEKQEIIKIVNSETFIKEF